MNFNSYFLILFYICEQQPLYYYVIIHVIYVLIICSRRKHVCSLHPHHVTVKMTRLEKRRVVSTQAVSSQRLILIGQKPD